MLFLPSIISLPCKTLELIILVGENRDGKEERIKLDQEIARLDSDNMRMSIYRSRPNGRTIFSFLTAL